MFTLVQTASGPYTVKFDSDCNLQTKSDLLPFGGVSGSVKMSVRSL